MSRSQTLLLLASLFCAGCADFALDDPSFDLWCGGELCKWQTDEGRIERVGTWNRDDYGVSFVATPTQISQLREQAPPDCMLIETVADVAASARVMVEVDYGDDGTSEFEQLVAEARWAKLRFELPPPKQAGQPVRYILRKQGTGRAVIAHLRVSNSSSCVEARSRPEGASCTWGGVCASGRCSDGLCVRCELGGCGEGIQCASDAECASGQCLAGRCRSCGLSSTCQAFSACTQDSHCASGLCQGVSAPALLDKPPGLFVISTAGQCAQCRQDSECEGSFCHRGVCAACRSDGDCVAGERCRYSQEFDASERVCSALPAAPRARGGLCEDDGDCADGLPCDASGEQPARCGRACTVPKQDCPASREQVCAPSSFVDHIKLDLDWSDPQSRVSTCYEREVLGLAVDAFGLRR